MCVLEELTEILLCHLLLCPQESALGMAPSKHVVTE